MPLLWSLTLLRARCLTEAAVLGLLQLVARPTSVAPHPVIAYKLHVDPKDSTRVDVAVSLRDAPSTFHLATKVHPEYDARYWRYLSDFRVDGSADDSHASIEREDSTLWRVSLPGGHGVVHYRVNIQPDPGSVRRAWHLYVRTDGALINPPDVFLYSPELAEAPVRVELDAPPDWRIATALGKSLSAPNAATLLDSPILLGDIRQWSFLYRRAAYDVVYWPLPHGSPFDTAALVSQLKAVAREAVDIFRSAPVWQYYFLIEDGASDALEHQTSLTIGVPSARLALNPRASLPEITHEFFHTWNLVSIRPAGYNDLSYQTPTRTPSLWLGEGVTLYYADALVRRAGLADSISSRLDHLGQLLQRYYGSPAIVRVPPARASLAFGESFITNPDATGGYYLQGELLGGVLDALIRDSTHEARGLDDVMRALYEQSIKAGYHGYVPADIRTTVASVCACQMSWFFDDYVDGAKPISVAPVLARIGLQLVLDSTTAADSSGRPLPDIRVGTDFSAPPAIVHLILTNPTTAWAVAGLRSGDEVFALNGVELTGRDQFRSELGRLHVGDTALVDIRRSGAPLRIPVPVGNYLIPRARFIDAPAVTSDQRARRRDWMAGH